MFAILVLGPDFCTKPSVFTGDAGLPWLVVVMTHSRNTSKSNTLFFMTQLSNQTERWERTPWKSFISLCVKACPENWNLGWVSLVLQSFAINYPRMVVMAVAPCKLDKYKSQTAQNAIRPLNFIKEDGWIYPRSMVQPNLCTSVFGGTISWRVNPEIRMLTWTPLLTSLSPFRCA